MTQLCLLQTSLITIRQELVTIRVSPAPHLQTRITPLNLQLTLSLTGKEPVELSQLGLSVQSIGIGVKEMKIKTVLLTSVLKIFLNLSGKL